MITVAQRPPAQRAIPWPGGRPHLEGQALNGRQPGLEGLPGELGAEQAAAASMLTPAELQDGVAVDQVGRALRDGGEYLIVEIRSDDILVPGDEVPVVQLVPENRMVITQDPVVRVGIAAELRAI